MQERYLFRGKRIDNGEWVERFYVQRPNDPCGKKQYIVILGRWIEVDPSTICQCTGLKDKNGDLIWENDIIKHYNDDSHPEKYCTGIVLWDENYAGFYRTDNEYGFSKPRINSRCCYEVIGNRFDNPELLEV